MAPQLGAPSGEAGYEDGAGDDALPPVSGRESTTFTMAFCYRLRTRYCVVCCVIITTHSVIRKHRRNIRYDGSDLGRLCTKEVRRPRRRRPAGPTLLWGKRGVNPRGKKVAIREIHNKHVV